jgi:hypothetical protein
VTRDVLLVPAPGPAAAIDAAYRAKYGSSTLVASPQARAATVRIDPAWRRPGAAAPFWEPPSMAGVRRDPDARPQLTWHP